MDTKTRGDKPSTIDKPDIDIIYGDKKKKINWRWFERAFWLTCLTACFLVGAWFNDQHRKEEIISATAINILTQQKNDLEEKLANLKNKEDLARRDLELYIRKKYRTIPNVVAKEVALQAVRLTKEERVPFSLIVGLMETESQFKPWAISKKDARGLMQIMPFWVTKEKELGLKIEDKYNLHDIEINIRAGIRVFKYHLREAENDINKGLYLYVGKDSTYANKVFNAMGRFEIFRSTLDTSFRAEEDEEASPVEEKESKEKS